MASRLLHGGAAGGGVSSDASGGRGWDRTSEPTLVTVTTAAPWPVGNWPGLLSYWRRYGDAWRGFVAFSTGVGQQRLGWFSADQLSPGLPLGRDEVREVDVYRCSSANRPAEKGPTEASDLSFDRTVAPHLCAKFAGPGGAC